jgi:chromosome segregation ATPase
MEKKITKTEEKKAKEIKAGFFEVHSQISQIQNEMNNLNRKAEVLIKKLEILREEESSFVRSLGEKYGEGTLDPFNMTYKIKEENEIHS